MALTVEITGGENIDQDEQVTLTATVTDANGNTPPGTLEYAWTASRGSFVGATNEASAVYHADFTDASAVDVTITCNVTRAANATPTSSGPSLTALAEIGVTGILVNMFMTALGAVSPNTNNVLYSNSTGTLDTESDQRLSNNVNIHQLRWDNQTGFNHFVLNNNESGVIGDFFRNNNNQSVYLIFENGTYKELTPTDFANAGSSGHTWARWEVTDATILALLNALSATSDLVVGIGDTGAIGWDADSGSDTETFTAATVPPLTIEAIDEQSIPVLTEDYELEIDIGGDPERAYVDGDMEGFYHTWDTTNSKIRIKAELVTRLISSAIWNVHLVKGTKTLDAQIIYNVVPSAPVISDPGAQKLYKGIPFHLNVDIANKPAIARGSGLLSGLKYAARADGADGLNIAGMLPAGVNLTEASFDAALYAENNGGSDNLDVLFDIATPVLYARMGRNIVRRLTFNGDGNDVLQGESFTHNSLSGSPQGYCAIDADYLYFTWNIFGNTNQVWRVDKDTANGQSVTATRLVTFGSRITQIRGVAIDGNDMYAGIDHNSTGIREQIYVYDKSTENQGNPSRRFHIPIDANSIRGIAIQGDSLIIGDQTDNALYWVDKSTANNAEATITKTVNLPSDVVLKWDISVVGGVVFIMDETNKKIHAVNANVADGGTAELLASYGAPDISGQLMLAIAIGT